MDLDLNLNYKTHSKITTMIARLQISLEFVRLPNDATNREEAEALLESARLAIGIAKESFARIRPYKPTPSNQPQPSDRSEVDAPPDDEATRTA